jgi:NADH-quinone oxidoreductase subunit N
MNRIGLLLPVLSLSAFAMALLGWDTLDSPTARRLRPMGFWLALAGLAVAAASMRLPAVEGGTVIYARGMLVADGLSNFMTWIAILGSWLVVLMSRFDQAFEGNSLGAYFGLLFFSAVGLILVASSNDLLMIFLSIELVGVPAFVLTGFLRRREKSNEAAIKFFLIGAFSSAMLAYGLSILYGVAGHTSLAYFAENVSVIKAHASLVMLAIFFILVSFGFKMALVPFHLWVPDAFEGAPIPIAAFLSVGPKLAGLAVTLRVFSLNPAFADLPVMPIFVALSALTMTIANLVGLKQSNVVRLLAYSSIAHLGYLLLGLIGGGAIGISSVYFYGWVYLFMNLGAFAAVLCVSNALGSTQLSAYEGLARRSPLLSALLTLYLVSLAGIPPTAGFVAKFFVFSSAFQAGWVWLVVLAALNSVISVGYYFKIVRAMYFGKPTESTPISIAVPERFVLGVTSFVTLVFGVAPPISWPKP